MIENFMRENKTNLGSFPTVIQMMIAVIQILNVRFAHSIATTTKSYGNPNNVPTLMATVDI